MEKAKHLELDGRRYVILVREEYERFLTLEKAAALPPLPEPDAKGNLPAVEYARASIARDLVRRRAELGLTQRDLAKSAGVRVETLCRIETGKHTASTATLAKLEAALAATRAKAGKPTPKYRAERKRKVS